MMAHVAFSRAQWPDQYQQAVEAGMGTHTPALMSIGLGWSSWTSERTDMAGETNDKMELPQVC
jgi:hypothetical protein